MINVQDEGTENETSVRAKPARESKLGPASSLTSSFVLRDFQSSWQRCQCVLCVRRIRATANSGLGVAV